MILKINIYYNCICGQIWLIVKKMCETFVRCHGICMLRVLKVTLRIRKERFQFKIEIWLVKNNNCTDTKLTKILTLFFTEGIQAQVNYELSQCPLHMVKRCSAWWKGCSLCFMNWKNTCVDSVWWWWVFFCEEDRFDNFLVITNILFLCFDIKLVKYT